MKKLIFFFSLLSVVNNNNFIGFCDIKGSVNNPGVYEIKVKETIYDIIKKAGGLKKNAYTDNINLSKLVSDEMVIYIHSQREVEKAKELANCNCEPIIKYVECDTTSTKSILKGDITSTTSKLSDKISTTTKLVTESTTFKLITNTTKVISTNQTTEVIILKILTKGIPFPDAS